MIYKLQTGKILPIIRKISKPISIAERLGIPKALRSNPKALEDPYYWGYQQWNSRYNAAVNSGNIQEVQRLRDLHFKIKALNNKLIESRNPLTLYHFSDAKFTQFDPKKIGVNDPGFYGKGIYTSPQRSYASTYGKNEYKLYGYSKHPFETRNDIDRSAASFSFNRIDDGSPMIDLDMTNLRSELQNADAVYHQGVSYARDDKPIWEVVIPESSRLKLADPIIRTDAGEIIPIVKRDNFHNPDTRFKQGGIIKLQKAGLVPIIKRLLKITTKNSSNAVKALTKNTNQVSAIENVPDSHLMFRAPVYKGGSIRDPYFSFFTTDPEYAKQYGPVSQYILEQKGPVAIAKEPMIGSSDIVTNDMFVDRNTKDVPGARIILGHDLVTSDIPIKSKGLEILSINKPNLLKLVSDPQAATTFHFDWHLPSIRPISLQEKLGWTKNERTQTAPKHQIPISLINRSDSYLPIEGDSFVLESPEISKKLASVHFTMNQPVTAHGGGSWDSASTTLIFPYGNIRKIVGPINIEPMDTFFPNYNGLRFKTKGAKVLTGDRTVHDYYTQHGVDSQFSEELEALLKEYKSKAGLADKYLEEHDWLPDENYYPLRDAETAISDKIQQIHYNFVDKNAMRPSYSDLLKLEQIEGLKTGAEPIRYNSVNTPLERKLGYTWYSAPQTHSNLTFYDPGDNISNLPKPMQEFVKWLWEHKADYRKQGGKI